MVTGFKKFATQEVYLFFLSKTFKDSCGCIWHVMDDLNLREHMRLANLLPNEYCSERNATQDECIEREMKTYDHTVCGCRPACQEKVMKTQISSSLWPSTVGWYYRTLQHNLT